MQKLILLSVFFIIFCVNSSIAEEADSLSFNENQDLSVTIDNLPVEVVVVGQTEEEMFLEKLKNCDSYQSKDTRPFDPTQPATKIVGWENEKCRLNTISIVGSPLRCHFTKEKLSEIVQAYSDMLNQNAVDMNDNAILQALSDEDICPPDYPEGVDYYSEEVLTQMANKIAKCEAIEIDNINPLTATITKRIIKGYEGDTCIYIETFPGNLNMICKYPKDRLQELSSAYSELVLELSQTGKITTYSKAPNIIEKLNNNLAICKIDNVKPIDGGDESE